VRISALAVLALAVCTDVLSGCTTRPPPPLTRFAKAGATQDAFMKDRYACIQQAQQTRSVASINQGRGGAYTGVVISRGVFMSCMGARRYAFDPNGPLAAPPGTVVLMVE
jgi:hypothetical protein